MAMSVFVAGTMIKPWESGGKKAEWLAPGP
jgi:hypothetical protein